LSGQGLSSDYATRSLNVNAGTPVVVSNGRIVKIPSHLTYPQMVADFKLMDIFEYRFMNAKKVLDVVEHTTYVGVATDDITRSPTLSSWRCLMSTHCVVLFLLCMVVNI
jgi:hypothetical protein